MPFHLHDIAGTLPENLQGYGSALDVMRRAVGPTQREGVAYLTVDERQIERGASQRRPGLHVDGWHRDGQQATFGGGGMWGGGGWGRLGMVMASTHIGAVAYVQDFDGEPAEYGDCEHLRSQIDPDAKVTLYPGMAYGCGSLTVHESIPSPETCARQFLRLSLPSNAGWPASCTPNPLGIQPGGPILPARPSAYTNYQP